MSDNQHPSPEEELRSLEGDTETRNKWTRINKLESIAEGYEDSGEEEKKEKILEEAEVFKLETKNSIRAGEEFSTRFYSIDRGEPDYQEYDLGLLQERAEETGNEIHKSKICDFLWESDCENDYTYAKKAVESYLDCAEIYLKNNHLRKMEDALYRSISLAMQLNNENLKRKTKDKILDIIRGLLSNNSLGFIPSLSDALLDLIDVMSSTEQSNLQNCLEECIENADDESMILKSSFRESIKNLKNAQGHQGEVANQEDLIVREYKEKGEFLKHEDPPMAAHYFRIALEYSYKFGNNNHVSELKDLLRTTNKKVVEEMEEFTVEIDATEDQEAIVNFIDDLLSKEIEDALFTLTAEFVPDYEQQRQQSKKYDQQFVHRQLFQTVHYHSRGITYSPSDDEQRELVNFARDYRKQIEFNALYLEKIFTSLEDNGDLDTASIISFLENWEYAREEDLELIKMSLDHYFNGDYVSSIHILVPRLENMFRGYIASYTGDASAYDREDNYIWLRDKTLTQLLSIEDTGDVDDDYLTDILEYMKFLLVKPYGINIRNIVSHGLCGKDVFSKRINCLLIHLLLVFRVLEIGE